MMYIIKVTQLEVNSIRTVILASVLKLTIKSWLRE